MIYLVHADSLSYDYSKLPLKVDFILSDPPFFNHEKQIGTFASDSVLDAKRMITWFQMLLVKTKARLAIVHATEEHFLRITKKKWKSIKLAGAVVANVSGKWQTISELDVYSLMSRFFGQYEDKTLLDPMCGSGHILKVADTLGMNAIGIDKDREQIAYAEGYTGGQIF